MREVSVMTCSKSGAAFPPIPPQTVSPALLSDRRSLDVAPDSAHRNGRCPGGNHRRRHVPVLRILSDGFACSSDFLGGLAFTLSWNLHRGTDRVSALE